MIISKPHINWVLDKVTSIFHGYPLIWNTSLQSGILHCTPVSTPPVPCSGFPGYLFCVPSIGGSLRSILFLNVQPTPMDRRMVDFHAFCQAPRFLWSVPLIQGCFRMDIQVVHDKDYFFVSQVAFVQQTADFFLPVVCLVLFPGRYVPPSCRWLRKHKDAAWFLSRWIPNPSFVYRPAAWAAVPWFPQAAGKAFHPYRWQDAWGHRASRKHPGYPPCVPQTQVFFWRYATVNIQARFKFRFLKYRG